jgi:hypothetical protein
MKFRSISTVAILTCAAVLALKASAVQAAAYNFNVESATATDDDTGEWIRLSGAGQFSFSDTSGSVKGHGHYKHFSTDGQVLANGTWAATEFGDFTDLGKENPGIQLGILEITVTLFPVGGPPVPGVTLTVNCMPDEGPGEGIKVEIPDGPSFLEPSGFTLISPQPGR